MNAMSLGILLLIAAIVLVVIVCIVKKQKENKELDSPDEDVSIKKGEIHEKPKRSEKPKITQNVVNIYEYNEKSTAVICPCCDGENNAHAAKCMICGEKLS